MTPLSSLPWVETERFEGPLDLLLEEVRRQNVAVQDIALAPLAARFLNYMRAASECQLNLDIEWIHMAATLIQWKSRSLLPADPTADLAADPKPDPIRDALVRQLLAHRYEAAQDLGQRRSVEQARFSRLPLEESRDRETGESEEAPFVSVWDLVQQARELARWAQEHRDQERGLAPMLGIEEEEVTVSKMMQFLREELAADGKGDLDVLRLLADQPTQAHWSCLFLGMLEMARNLELQINQREMFGPLFVCEGPALRI